MRLGKGLSGINVDKLMYSMTGQIEPDEAVQFVCKCNNFKPMMDRVVVTTRRVLGTSQSDGRIRHSSMIDSDTLVSVEKGWAGTALTLVDGTGARIVFKQLDEGDAQTVQDIVAAGPQEVASDHVPVGNPHGQKVFSGTFGGHSIEVYDGGFIRVALFMKHTTPYERLLSINTKQVVQDKSAGGRALASAATAGISNLYSNEKRRVYLTIATDVKTRSLMQVNGDREALSIEAAGQGILEAIRHTQLITPTAQSAPQEPQTQPQHTGTDPIEQLQRLKNMREADLITDEEYAAKRAEILNRL